MLKLDKVKKHYKEFELDCSLEVQAGCVTGLIGKNGAGKSTTFKLVLGLIYPDSGSVHIFGKPAEALGTKDKENIGVVLADSGFNGYLTVNDLIPVLASLYHKFNKEDFIKRCREFDLPMNQKMKEFSTGMKRKLQVLAAISHEAELLVLDEPTAGLDVVARDELLGLLREYMERDGRAVLISSHISGDLEGFCDDVYMIDDGQIILHEETDQLLSSYGLLKMTEKQYADLDKTYILRRKKEHFGMSCLTDQKQFYIENYPQVAVEKGSIDELIMMMVRGERL
ncbi:MAG: ABC transporter ATP-binding protein [Eubacterium sp.]|nr:ABC transporter ATP-binding protein [Eubacterium sp.]MCI8918247.1 ABC transporter ATP-binding protein [Eubacterium sp.]